MRDKRMFETENINNYDLYVALKESLGEAAVPLPTWMHKLGEYYYVTNKYPHVSLEDALVLAQRDISNSFVEIDKQRATCCGGGGTK